MRLRFVLARLPFVVVAMLTVVVARPAAAHPSGATVDKRVLIIGDSVILGAQGALSGRLGGSGWQATQISSVSQHTYDAPAVVDANAGAIGDAVVVALGTNDGANPVQFAGWIDALMGRLQGVPRVYWVNIRQFADWVPAANTEIAAASDRWPNLEVIDWNARSVGDPALVYGDGIHLTAAGQNAMAELVGGTLDTYAAGNATTTTTTTTTAPPEPSTTTTAKPRKPRSSSTTGAPTSTGNGSTDERAQAADDSDDEFDPDPFVVGGATLVAVSGIVFLVARRPRT